MNEYEGWKNRETFEVALYLSNDAKLYHRTLDWMQGQETIHPNGAKYFVGVNLPLYVPGHGLDLALVDWTEIAEELTIINDEAHA